MIMKNTKRKIKFRAYDKTEQGKMCKVLGIEFETNRIKLANHATITSTGKKAPEWCNLLDYNLMQYTNLRDKNGVEIYEGDILDCKKDYWGENSLRTVVWDEFDACFYFYNPLYSVDSDSPKKALTSSFISEFQREVIGNIYQNPELLK